MGILLLECHYKKYRNKLNQLIKIAGRKYYHDLLIEHKSNINKANLRDLIAATGLVISNWIQIVNFSARVTVKFDGQPRKTIGHFFYATSSFVHHFKSIGEFKLDLQSRNAQFGSKLVIFYPMWPSWKFDGWPWKTIGHLFYTTPNFVHHFKAIGEVKPELQSGKAQVGSKLVIFCPASLWNLMDDLEKQ